MKQDWFEKSLPGRWLDNVACLAARGAKEPLRRTVPGKKITTVQWFLGVGILVMYGVPHVWWNNLAGVCFAVLAAVWYWRTCARSGETPLGLSRLGAGVWAFLLLCVLSTLLSADRMGSARVLVFFAGGFVLSYTLAGAFHRTETLRWLLGVLYIVLILTAAFGLTEYFTGLIPETRQVFWNAPSENTALYRLCSTLENPNNYGEFAAMIFPLALIWAVSVKKKVRRVLLLGLLALPVAALVLTFSRTGWIALALSLLILLRFWKRKAIPVALAAGVLCVLLLPAGTKERVLSILDPRDASVAYRFEIWRNSLTLWRNHWLFGIGLGPDNFQPAYSALLGIDIAHTPPHSNMGYLEILVETGLAGFAAFCCFFFGILRRLAVSLPRGTGFRCWVGRACLAALGGMALGFVPEYVWFYPRNLFAWCILLGVALGYLQDGEETES